MPLKPGVKQEETAATRLLRVVTRCTTRTEFLATFDRYVDETSVFIATHQPRPVGAKLPFAIALKDGEAVLRGEGEVIESHGDSTGPQRRPGMRLSIHHLDQHSAETHALLMQRKRSHMEAPAQHGAVTPPHGTGTPPQGTATPPPIPQAALAAGSPKPVPANETRTPSSSTVVPANPFGELQPAALEYFVECTLYEESTPQGTAKVPSLDPALFGLSKPSPSRSVPPVEPAVPVDLTHLAVPAVPARARGLWKIVLTGVMSSVIGLLGGKLLWSAPAMPEGPIARPLAAVTTPAPQAEAAAPSATAEKKAETGDGKRETGNGKPETGGTEPAVAAPVPAAAAIAAPEPAPVPAAAPAAAAVIPAPAPSPAPEPSRVVPAGECQASITSDPPGAAVRIDGKPAGRTPIESVKVGCGDVPLILEHPRYQRVDTTLHVNPGEEARLEQLLVRPHGSIELRSSPPGASFQVNGSFAGKSPTHAAVQGFTSITVKAQLDGYAPWSERVYVRGLQTSLTAQLQPSGSGVQARPAKVTAKPRHPVRPEL